MFDLKTNLLLLINFLHKLNQSLISAIEFIQYFEKINLFILKL